MENDNIQFKDKFIQALEYIIYSKRNIGSEQLHSVLKSKADEFKHIKSVKELLDATKLSKEELETTIEMKKKEMDEMKKKISEISTSVDKVSESFQFDFKELEGKFNEIKEGIKNIRID